MKKLDFIIMLFLIGFGGFIGFGGNDSVSASDVGTEVRYLERPNIVPKLANVEKDFTLNVDLNSQQVEVQGNADCKVSVTTPTKVEVKYLTKLKTVHDTIPIVRYVEMQKVPQPVLTMKCSQLSASNDGLYKPIEDPALSR